MELYTYSYASDDVGYMCESNGESNILSKVPNPVPQAAHGSNKNPSCQLPTQKGDVLTSSLSHFYLVCSHHFYYQDLLIYTSLTFSWSINFACILFFKFSHCPTLGIRRQKLTLILLLVDKFSLCHSCGQSLLLTVQIRPLCYAVAELTPETVD